MRNKTKCIRSIRITCENASFFIAKISLWKLLFLFLFFLFSRRLRRETLTKHYFLLCFCLFFLFSLLIAGRLKPKKKKKKEKSICIILIYNFICPASKTGLYFFIKMKISEIKKEAKNIIADLFFFVRSKNEKDDWKKAFSFIDNKIYQLEVWPRGEALFYWREVRRQMTDKFGQKFIK